MNEKDMLTNDFKTKKKKQHASALFVGALFHFFSILINNFIKHNHVCLNKTKGPLKISILIKKRQHNYFF